MSEVTNLKQSETKIYIEGILASKEFEEITDKNGNPGVKGNVMIKVDDLNTIKIKVYVGKFTKDGKENKAWAGIHTVMSEYKSIAEVGEEAADRINTSAQFSMYRNPNGQDVVMYQSNFFNRNTKPLNPTRKFKAECFIKSKNWEVDNEGNETGRLKIRGIAPSYMGIDILDMICPVSNELDPNFAQDADNLFEVGSTYAIEGEIVNSRVEKKAVAALGSMTGKTEYKNELVVTGSSPAYEDENAYDKGAIDLAIQNYEDTQAQNAARANSEKAPFQKPSAASTGRSMTF